MGSEDDTLSCCMLIYSPLPSYLPALPDSCSWDSQHGAGTFLATMIPASMEGTQGGWQGAGFGQMRISSLLKP